MFIDDLAIASAQEDKKIIKDIKIDRDNYVKNSYNDNIVMFIDATCNINNDTNTT